MEELDPLNLGYIKDINMVQLNVLLGTLLVSDAKGTLLVCDANVFFVIRANSDLYMQLHHLETLLLELPHHLTNLSTDSRVLNQLLAKLKPTKEAKLFKR
ncbi:hypothetical protein ACH5RR_029072 [Cinchona calisaya]|uniref:Uncharacterized protein n=1 Tax=Cinchona calisaya TaxID=153742 RepID=A0ABD2YS18_9GENT